MRARLEDTYFKIGNPHFGTAAGSGKTKTAGGKAGLLINFEVTSKGKLNSSISIIRADDGSKAEIALNFVAGRDSAIPSSSSATSRSATSSSRRTSPSPRTWKCTSSAATTL